MVVAPVWMACLRIGWAGGGVNKADDPYELWYDGARRCMEPRRGESTGDGVLPLGDRGEVEIGGGVRADADGRRGGTDKGGDCSSVTSANAGDARGAALDDGRLGPASASELAWLSLGVGGASSGSGPGRTGGELNADALATLILRA